MTRGIFDPGSDNVMQGPGNGFLGEPGADHSKMPPSLVDGDVDAETAAEAEAESGPEAQQADVIYDEEQPTFDADPEAAADNLMHIEVEDEGQVDVEEDGIEQSNEEGPRQVE